MFFKKCKSVFDEGGGRPLGKRSKGAILIEFAFAAPIMIMLLYYIHDLVRLKRWQSQMQFVAHQMASMLQNVSQNRTSKTITRTDIKYIYVSSYLTIFPGTTQFVYREFVPTLGYTPMIWIYYVKGNADSTASVVWALRFHSADFPKEPNRIDCDSKNGQRAVVKNLKNVAPSKIYPSLKIQPGEVKIILECQIHYSQWSGYSFPDGRNCSQVSPREAFGFYVYPIAPTNIPGASNDSIYFPSVVIFSPRSGLFSETAPK